jgi:hypothetical protein
MPSFSELVRSHCRKRYIDPARIKGVGLVEIRAGDVHSDMRFTGRLPLVCSSLWALRFEHENNIKRLAVLGPLNGANTTFIFSLTDQFSGFDPVRCPLCPLWKHRESN